MINGNGLSGGEEAVLITGVFGSGKTSVVQEIADVLEQRGASYAAVDLDWLAWFDTGAEEMTVHPMMLLNLSAVVSNYLAAGVRFFILARSVRDRAELDGVKAALPMPSKVVRLTIPLEEIEKRLRSDVTAGRQDDLREAAAWVAASIGAGLEDFTVTNDRPIRAVAMHILDRLEWAVNDLRSTRGGLLRLFVVGTAWCEGGGAL